MMTAEAVTTAAESLLPPMPPGIAPDEYVPRSSLEVFTTMNNLTPLAQAARPILHEMGVRPLHLVEVPTDTPHTILTYDASVYPGGAYKFAGAAFGLMMRKQQNSDLQRVTTGSGGNFALALQKAGDKLDVQVTAHVPSNTSKQRLYMLRSAGLEVVHEGYNDVVAATAGARQDARRDPEGTTFLHAYNDPFVMRGQGITAEYLVTELKKYATRNDIDLTMHPTQLLAQVGGGSLITALAIAAENERRKGYLGNNVRVRQVRPEKKNGQLDPRYPGLAVESPGSWAEALIKDDRFVLQPQYRISPAQTGRALVRLASMNDGESVHEPSGVVGLAAALSLSETVAHPTLFVTLLSGRNDSQTAQQLSNLWRDGGKETRQQPQPAPLPHGKLAPVAPSPAKPAPAQNTAPTISARVPQKKKNSPVAQKQQPPTDATPAKPTTQPKQSKKVPPAKAKPTSAQPENKPAKAPEQPAPKPKKEEEATQQPKRVINNPGLSGPTANYHRGPYQRGGRPYRPDPQPNPEGGADTRPERRRKTPF